MIDSQNLRICFITKSDKPYVKEAIEFVENIFTNAEIYDCNKSNFSFNDLYKENYDIIISYISNWIISEKLLNKTKKWNINFHPGPPEYPGTGCFNFAIYNSETIYGTTAHIMEPNVDTGEIIGVKRFSISKKETVKSLSDKTYENLFLLFKEVIKYLINNNSLPIINENWKRKPYKRSDLEYLSTIDISMSNEEIKKRIRSTYFPGKPGPKINIGGYAFEYNPDR